MCSSRFVLVSATSALEFDTLVTGDNLLNHRCFSPFTTRALASRAASCFWSAPLRDGIEFEAGYCCSSCLCANTSTRGWIMKKPPNFKSTYSYLHIWHMNKASPMDNQKAPSYIFFTNIVASTKHSIIMCQGLLWSLAGRTCLCSAASVESVPVRNELCWRGCFKSGGNSTKRNSARRHKKDTDDTRRIQTTQGVWRF